jgi:hypothetical protein
MGPGEISITFDQPGILGMEYSRPLGVQSMPHVDDVDAGSPAAAAGVRPGLDLRSVNGREVVGMSDDDFVAVVSARPITMVFVDPAAVVAAGLAAAPPPPPGQPVAAVMGHGIGVEPQFGAPLGLPPLARPPERAGSPAAVAGDDHDDHDDHDEAGVTTLQEMGFSRRMATTALQLTGGSIEGAVMLISSGELAGMVDDDGSDSDGDSDASSPRLRLGGGSDDDGDLLSSSGSESESDDEDAGADLPPFGGPWQTRDQFDNNAEYGAYIQATLKVGYRVRARCHAEGAIEAGDTGEYVQTNGGEPPAQVQWDGYGGKYWVQWHHLDIIQPAADAVAPDAAGAAAPARPASPAARLDVVRAEPVNDALVEQLVAFGFERAGATAALQRVGGDLNAAIDVLSAGV